MFPLVFWRGSIAIRYASYHFQDRSVPTPLRYENHAEKIRSNGKRRSIRYENWNGAIGIRYHGKKVLENFIIISVDERFHTVKREAQNLHFVT